MSSRGGAVIIFILIATVIYGLAHFYVLRRGWRALDGTGAFRAILLVLTIACAILFFAGRAIVLRHPGAVTGVLAAVGYWYLAFFIYLLFLTLAVDLVRLIDAFFPFSRRPCARPGRAAAWPSPWFSARPSWRL